MLTSVSQQRRWPLLSARARFSMASQRFRATLAKSISWRSRIRRATLHLYRKSFVRRDTVLDHSTIAQASHCSCARSRDVKFLMESNRSPLTDTDKVITNARLCSDECPRRGSLRNLLRQHLTSWGRLREEPPDREPSRLPRRAAQSMPRCTTTTSRMLTTSGAKPVTSSGSALMIAWPRKPSLATPVKHSAARGDASIKRSRGSSAPFCGEN